MSAAAGRGNLLDWGTQEWVRATGRRVDLASTPWLRGPVGSVTGIGGDFFSRWAPQAGLEVRRDGAARGLLPDFSLLRGPSLEPEQVHPAVRHFYEQTSEYELEAWSEWCGAFRPFGRALAFLFSRRLQQLNVPIDSLDTSRGTTSEVLHLRGPASGRVVMAAWVRHLRATGNVLYAGAYSICRVPGHTDPCVQVAFPLPTGNALVILRPSVEPDGALTVTSSGRTFGDPGFYFTVYRDGERAWARYVRTMQESIRVYPGDGADVRADHTMWLWGQVFLRLHYRMRPRSAPARADAAVAAVPAS